MADAPEPTKPESPAFAPIGSTPFSEPSVLDKLWKLTESNFFWGGGVGMALAAYAFEIGGAPRFSMFLLVVAWLVISISVFRHGFFERSSKFPKRIYEGLISLVIGLVLIATWALLHPKRDVQQLPLASSSAPTPTVQYMLASPSAVPSAALSPTPLMKATPTIQPSASPVPTVAVDSRIPTAFLNAIPFKGGSVHRLDVLMKMAGYGGATDMEVLYVVNDEQNTSEIYLSTDAHPTPKNSQRLYPSEGFNFQRGEDTSSVFILSAKDGKINVEYRSR